MCRKKQKSDQRSLYFQQNFYCTEVAGNCVRLLYAMLYSQWDQYFEYQRELISWGKTKISIRNLSHTETSYLRDNPSQFICMTSEEARHQKQQISVPQRMVLFSRVQKEPLLLRDNPVCTLPWGTYQVTAPLQSPTLRFIYKSKSTGLARFPHSTLPSHH